MVGLVHLVEGWFAEWEVVGSIPVVVLLHYDMMLNSVGLAKLKDCID